MYKHTILLLPAVLIIIGIACRTEVEQDFPDFEKMPVLNSVLHADSSIWAHVSYSYSLGTAPEVSKNAQVCVFRNGVCIDTLKYEDNGMYRSDSTVQSGNEYAIRAYVTAYDTVVATQHVPTPSAILNTTYIPIVTRNEEGHVSGIDVEIENTPGSDSYYMITADGYAYGSYHKIRTNFASDDPSYIAEGMQYDIISNSYFKDERSFTVRLTYQQGMYYNEFQYYRIQLHTITPDFYEYMRSSFIYEQGRYPEFSFNGVPPYQLYSNTSNGIGICMAASSVQTDTIYIANRP